jgi:hypothetical protein
MSKKETQLLTGALLIVGAILINIPYTMLITTFDYPDILRAPTGEVLTRFAAGGRQLIWTWLAFAWVGLPLVLAILLLPRALTDGENSDRSRPFVYLATFFGATGALAQMFGLLRWSPVVSVLARMYTAPTAGEGTREAVAAVFQAVHQYGGVVVGEHIGQTFTVLWMILLSIGLLRKATFPRWLPVAGLVAAGVYALAQGELLATAMPGFPYWGAAGLVGSLLWLAWLIALGIILVRKAGRVTDAYEGQNPQRGVSVVQ